jgi:hypothetical protein
MAAQDDTLQKVVTRCWEDEAFKERLLADPAGVLKAEGVGIPEGVTVDVVVDAENVRTLMIPCAPARELTDEVLDAVAAAGGCVPGAFYVPE